MSTLFELFPGLKPYEFAIRVLGMLAVIFALMAAGAVLMHDRDEARYQAERANALQSAKTAQDQAVADAVTALQLDHQREMQAAQELHRQQIAAADTRAKVAQNIARNAQAYACKLDAAGFAAELEAFK